MNKVFEINYDGESYTIQAPTEQEAKQFFLDTQEVSEMDFSVDGTIREVLQSEWSSMTFKQEDRLAGMPDTDTITVEQYMQVFGNETGLICTTIEI